MAKIRTTDTIFDTAGIFTILVALPDPVGIVGVGVMLLVVAAKDFSLLHDVERSGGNIKTATHRERARD